MLTVHKFPIELGDNVVQLPRGAEVLHVAEQHGKICLWVLLNTLHEKTGRFFEVYGTGHPISEEHAVREHVGTILTAGGNLVWHVFEVF